MKMKYIKHILWLFKGLIVSLIKRDKVSIVCCWFLIIWNIENRLFKRRPYKPGTIVIITDAGDTSKIGQFATIKRVISVSPICYELEEHQGHWLHSMLLKEKYKPIRSIVR